MSQFKISSLIDPCETIEIAANRLSREVIPPTLLFILFLPIALDFAGQLLVYEARIVPLSSTVVTRKKDSARASGQFPNSR